MEDRGKHFDCDLMGSKYSCADSKNGFPNEMINCSVSENLDGASLSEAPVPTDEQVIITTPPTKFVTAAEGHSTDVKALKWKMSSITKKKATPKEDCKLKLCGMLLDDLLLLMHLCLYVLFIYMWIKHLKAMLNIQECAMNNICLDWFLLIYCYCGWKRYPR